MNSSGAECILALPNITEDTKSRVQAWSSQVQSVVIASSEESKAPSKDSVIPGLKAKAADILKRFPGNRCCKYIIPYLDSAEGKALSDEDFEVFRRCVQTGIDNEDSGLGCYAMQPDDYKKFGGFFNAVIRDYHGDETGKKKHVTDWDASSIGDGGVLDVRKLGFNKELSMRVRVGRNLTQYNLPGKMDQAERISFEKTMLKAFESLIKDPAYGGTVYSLTPDFGNGEANPNKISDAKYKELVDAHVLFKGMDADPFLKSAGISSDWPYGRGCWQSTDKQCIIWFGEEDQLRIMCMKKGYLLNEVFDRLNTMLKAVEAIDGIEFATSDDYGYVTSCPSNLGTGMRASVHVKIPDLTADGTDKKAKEVCKPLGLSVRGTGGEHTPIGADGTVDISPSNRLFIKESEIIGRLHEGIKLLMQKENPTPDAPPPPPAAAAPSPKSLRLSNPDLPSAAPIRVRASSGKVSSPFLKPPMKKSMSITNPKVKLRINVRVASAKGLPSVRALWGTTVSRYAVVTWLGESQQTEPAKGTTPTWGSSHTIQFPGCSPMDIDSNKVKIEVYEGKHNVVQASLEFDGKLIPKEGKMVSTMRKEFELTPQGTVQVEAWCARL